MALAGYCRQCAQYVYLNNQWGCMNGHAWNEISGWYEPETGAPVTPPWMQIGTRRDRARIRTHGCCVGASACPRTGASA